MSTEAKAGFSMIWPDHSSEYDSACRGCRQCGEPSTGDGSLVSVSFSPTSGAIYLLCRICFRKNYSECRCCDNYALKSTIYKGWCRVCVFNAPTKLIRKYSYKLPSDPIGHSPDKIWFGVELELESRGDYGKDTFDVHRALDSFAVLKKDASIARGFEIVTYPATIPVHKERWGRILPALPSTVFADTTCGMHVHVSRHNLRGTSDLQVGKILTFIHAPANRDFISLIAGRGSSYHNDFTKPKSVTDGRRGGMSQKDNDRHTAFNCNNSHTLEFRIFQAVTDYEVFAKNLEFCDAIMAYTAPSMVSLTDYRNLPTFLRYVFSNRKRYSHLHNFLVAHPSAKDYHSIVSNVETKINK